MIPMTTNWGGRRERYAILTGASNRFQDPATHEFLQVSTSLQLENWIDQRFRPDVKTVEIFNSAVQRDGDGGAPYSARPSLLVTLYSGEQELQLIVHYARDCRRARNVRRMAKAIGASFVLRDLLTVRRNLVRADALEYLLQCSCARANELAPICQVILASLQATREAKTSELYSLLPDSDECAVDGALAQLHLIGKVEILFSLGGSYDRSRVTLR